MGVGCSSWLDCMGMMARAGVGCMGRGAVWECDGPLGTATGNLHHLYIVEVRATWASASGPGPTPVHWCWAHALSVQRCRKRRFAPSYLRCCKRFGDPSLLPIVSSEGISPKKEPFSNPNQPFDARNEGKLASEGRRNQKIPKTKPFRRKIQP